MSDDVRVNGVSIDEYKDDSAPGPDWEQIGETDRTLRGYSILVGSVRFDSLGPSIRLVLRQNGAFIRHMDISGELCVGLLPLIEAAARRGGDLVPVTAGSDPLWWDRVSVSVFAAQADTLTVAQLIPLEKEIHAAVASTRADWEMTRSPESGGNLKWRRLKREIVTARRRALDPTGKGGRAGRPVGAEKKDLKTFDHLLIRALGEELRSRLGDETANEIFASAKNKVSAPQP